MVKKKTYKVVTTEITKTMSIRMVKALTRKDILDGEVPIYDFEPVSSVEVEFDHEEIISVTEVK